METPQKIVFIFLASQFVSTLAFIFFVLRITKRERERERERESEREREKERERERERKRERSVVKECDGFQQLKVTLSLPPPLFLPHTILSQSSPSLFPRSD